MFKPEKSKPDIPNNNARFHKQGISPDKFFKLPILEKQKNKACEKTNLILVGP